MPKPEDTRKADGNGSAFKSRLVLRSWGQAMRGMIAHHEMFGVGVLVVVGVMLLARVAAKQAPMDQVAS
jgi:hypothetical protein